MSFTEKSLGELKYMTAPNITAVHAFTTRHGGVSRGIFESLNFSADRGDKPENVSENYRRLCAVIGGTPDGLAFSRQVHKTDIRVCTEADRHTLFTEVPYEADGLITDTKGLPLIIFTADCIPILLHDPVRGAIGAVHAGWRGTVGGIAGRAVRLMEERFSCRTEDIRAAIGPGICQSCFETGPEVPEALREVLGGEAEKFISAGRGDRQHVNLKGANRRLMELAGLKSENISVSDECTMCLPHKYWSHRYTNGKRGSQASVIVL